MFFIKSILHIVVRILHKYLIELLRFLFRIFVEILVIDFTSYILYAIFIEKSFHPPILFYFLFHDDLFIFFVHRHNIFHLHKMVVGCCT